MTFRNLETHEKRVADWNAAHPKGAKVAVSKDDHSIVFGETTSEAYMMGGHSAVIHVSGVRGAYSLFRVTAMPNEVAA